jgi:N-acetylneuraminic acid mutarotase
MTASPISEPLDHTGCASHDGKLYLVGGFGERNMPTNTLYIYDPSNDEWNKGHPMPTARHHHTSETVDGKLFIIGGRETGIQSNTDTNEMYDPEQDTWVVLNHMPTKGGGLSAASIGNHIFVMGGHGASRGFDINEKYDTTTDSWTLESPMPNPRLGHDAVAFNNKIYVFEGKTSHSKETTTGITEIFNVKDASDTQLD